MQPTDSPKLAAFIARVDALHANYVQGINPPVFSIGNLWRELMELYGAAKYEVEVQTALGEHATDSNPQSE